MVYERTTISYRLVTLRVVRKLAKILRLIPAAGHVEEDEPDS